jgi:TRAP-type C4-dicarboxylate transport system substrate-binding protein
MEAFAKELEERSGGRYKVNISYGSVMAKPPEHFDLALTGVAEMAFVGLPWNPGRFRMSELFGLPIRNASAEQASKALWEMYKRGYMDKEFADVKVVFLLTTPAYEYLWAKEPVTSLAGFKGKKIRAPGGPWSGVAKALGGVPVSAPVGEIYGMMEKGIVDGANFPWSGIRSYKLAEVTKYATKVSMLYFAFGVIMNKDVWEGLPKDVQAIIDEVGAKYSAMGGRGHDEWNKYGLEDLAKVGVVPTPLPPAEMQKIEKLLAPLWDKWIADNEAKGLPAKKAVDDLYSILTGLGVEDPFIR